MKKQRLTTEKSMEESTDATASFTGNSDLCEQLMHRYGKSAAPQHRHLCATAAATRSIIESESLPLTPLSYFAATIDALSGTTLDANAVSALSSFLAIVLPLVPEKSIAPSKAAEAAEIVVELVERPCEGLPVSSVRALVKCLGVLVEFCNLEDWKEVKLGFEELLKFSVDKRPKVRKCAQDCVVKVFKAFQSPLVKKKASKLVLTLFKTYMPLAVKSIASRSIDGCRDDDLSKSEHLEVLHMLNLLKFLVPYLPGKVISKTVVELQKLMSSKFSALTRHIFDVMEDILQFVEAGTIIPEAANLVEILASYISLRQNPVDTLFSAASLLEKFLMKVQLGEPSKWNSHFSLITGSIAGLLTSEATASRASNTLQELIDRHITIEILSGLEMNDEPNDSKESRIVKSLCDVLLKVLNSCRGTPNEHTLAIISFLFLKLGERSHIYMEGILVKLASFMTVACGDTSNVKHLQECMGSAVVAMGPEKLLSLLPISFNAGDLTCSNIWLIPILKEHVAGSSLGFFIESVLTLAESFQQACQKVKKSVIGQDLQAHAHGCWGLLPSFCRHPNDTHKKFGSLTKRLIPLLRKDSVMLEDIAIALQHLVNENRNILGSDQSDGEMSKLPKMSHSRHSPSEPPYSKKTAAKNIKALASCSEEWLQALTNVFFEVPLDKRAFLKDTIGCLASVTESSVVKKIFVSSVERFELLKDVEECGRLDASVERDNTLSTMKSANRFLILELASSIIGAASEDLLDLIFNFIKQSLQEADESILIEAYLALNKILEESSGFCSSKFEELMDLLLGLKSAIGITSLKWRFACFRTLLIHSIEITLGGENTNGFRMLNEIIVALKDSTEEGRKVAYDTLLGICSRLQRPSSSLREGPYYEFVSMIMGYLSGSSPHIKSGAVSALSLVIYNDSGVCNLMPDLVPSILELLHTKAVEVIKAVLGFLKVLVLSLQVRDLHNFLSDILDGVMPWSSVSRHHFRSKVTVILEIVMRRCGSAPVKSLIPEKYQDFVKSVLENRHGKMSSQEAATTEADTKLSDSTPKGRHTRQPKRAGSFVKEEHSIESRKRKRDDKHGSNKTNKFSARGNNVHRRKEVKHSGRVKPIDRQSHGVKRKNMNFNRDHSGQKRNSRQKQARKM